MAGVGSAEPVFSRFERGASRPLADSLHARSIVVREWGAVRAAQLEAEPQEIPEGYHLGHVITLNLGAETSSESCFEGQGWHSHRTPHHGVSVFPALQPYALHEHQPRALVVVEMAAAFVSAALAECDRVAEEIRPVVGARDSVAAHVLLALAEGIRRSDGSAGTLLAESLGTALAAHLAEAALGAAPLDGRALSSPKLRRVLDYVGGHLDAPLALRTLAGLVDMETSGFMRAFKQSTGLSPHRYVLEARIERAKQLLRDRGLAITDIALETGFATPSHFAFTFRRIVGVTPRAFRETIES